MLIQLSLDIWLDILDWLQRRQLVQKLDAICDSQLAGIVQFWLHGRKKKIKLGKLSFCYYEKSGLNLYNQRLTCSEWKWNRDEMHGRKHIHTTYGCYGDRESVPIAEHPILENIESFKEIRMDYFDATIYNFLQNMRPLLRNIHLSIISNLFLYTINGVPNNDVKAIKITLSHLLPLVDGIEAISIILSCGCSHHLYDLRDHFPTALDQSKWLSIMHIDSRQVENNLQVFADWLHTIRSDGQPRMFRIQLDGNGTSDAGPEYLTFLRILKEHFHHQSNQQACSFFIRFWPRYDISELCETNERTGEKFKVQISKNEYSERFGLISRCPINADAEWVAEKEQEVLNWKWSTKERVIVVEAPKIGVLPKNGDEKPKKSNFFRRLIGQWQTKRAPKGNVENPCNKEKNKNDQGRKNPKNLGN